MGEKTRERDIKRERETKRERENEREGERNRARVYCDAVVKKWTRITHTQQVIANSHHTIDTRWKLRPLLWNTGLLLYYIFTTPLEVLLLYFPSIHSVQGPPFGPCVPALQLQSSPRLVSPNVPF